MRNFVRAVAGLSGENGTEVCLASDGPSTVTLLAIWSHEERRAGYASAVLKKLCSLADTHGVDIKLTPRWLAYEDDEGESSEELTRLDGLNAQKLSNEQLIAWYERNGFQCTEELDGDFPVMRRAALTSSAKQ